MGLPSLPFKDQSKFLESLFLLRDIITVKGDHGVPLLLLLAQSGIDLFTDVAETQRTFKWNDNIKDQIGMGRPADHAEIMKAQPAVNLFQNGFDHFSGFLDFLIIGLDRIHVNRKHDMQLLISFFFHFIDRIMNLKQITVSTDLGMGTAD